FISRLSNPFHDVDNKSLTSKYTTTVDEAAGEPVTPSSIIFNLTEKSIRGVVMYKINKHLNVYRKAWQHQVRYRDYGDGAMLCTNFCITQRLVGVLLGFEFAYLLGYGFAYLLTRRNLKQGKKNLNGLALSRLQQDGQYLRPSYPAYEQVGFISYGGTTHTFEGGSKSCISVRRLQALMQAPARVHADFGGQYAKHGMLRFDIGTMVMALCCAPISALHNDWLA
nr:hypothetical protein [Tanacetum cinerariifolium]